MLVYTFVPIVVVILMSFNDPDEPQLIYRFDGFTLDNWQNPCERPEHVPALGRSIEIGLLATLGATVLGTLAAFALVRHRFDGRSAANLLIFLPMAAPEIVMGSSLLALFVAAGFAGQLGFWTILIAHIMFCLSFVVVTVRARLAAWTTTSSRRRWTSTPHRAQTFWRVTFPLVFPGILGAALLASRCPSTTSSSPTSTPATTTTFPMYVWGVAQRGVPMQVNVIGTLMFLVSIADRRRRRAEQPAAARRWRCA